jgi:hypothetical protein
MIFKKVSKTSLGYELWVRGSLTPNKIGAMLSDLAHFM